MGERRPTKHDEDLARQLSTSLGEYLTTGELLKEIELLAASGDRRRALPVPEIASARGDAGSHLQLARLAAQAERACCPRSSATRSSTDAFRAVRPQLVGISVHQRFSFRSHGTGPAAGR